MLKPNKGFTLVEIMIALAILGLLMAIAIPKYSDYVTRGNQAAAKAVLLDIAQREAQYLIDNRAYLGLGSNGDLSLLGVSAPTNITGIYTFTAVPSNAPPGFVAKATPQTANAGTITYSIDNTGQRQIWTGAVATGTW